MDTILNLNHFANVQSGNDKGAFMEAAEGLLYTIGYTMWLKGTDWKMDYFWKVKKRKVKKKIAFFHKAALCCEGKL